MGRALRVVVALILSVLVLLPITCTGEHLAARGVEAVPPGQALLIEGTYRHLQQVESRLGVVMIPERGLFRIEETAGAPYASLRLTVRTPQRQAAYRGQAFLEGDPHPLRLAFLRSPLTQPEPDEEVRGLKRDGARWTGTLDAAGEEFALVAETDAATGLVTFESYDSGHESYEVRRRLVPLESVRPPTIDEVYAYARADWEKEVVTALRSPIAVDGRDVPGLVPHRLQVHGDQAWLSYSLRDDPMRTCVDLTEVAASGSDALSGGATERTKWKEIVVAEGDSRLSGGRAVGGRWVSLLIGQGVKRLHLGPDALAAALTPLAELPNELRLGPPRLLFDGPMPLPGASRLLR